jgi:predicted SAM-dependent methyltransferase
MLMRTLLSSVRSARQKSRALSVPLLRMNARRRLEQFPSPRRLNLGCGRTHFDGWVNLDSNRKLDTVDLVWDLRNGLPNADASCSLIYSEHLLEHLTAADGLSFLRECRRALVPAGVLRIAMPSLDDILDRAVSPNWKEQAWLTRGRYRDIATRAEMLNVAFRDWGHQYLYDREELHRRLHEAGFSTVQNVEHGQSEHAELRGRETRADSMLICEARP